MQNQTEMLPDREHLMTILLAREHARADAWMRKDKRALAALLEPDFVETNSLGRFERSAILDRLLSVLTINDFGIEEPRLRSSGSSPELTYRCRETYTVNGIRRSGVFTVTARYRRGKGTYQLAEWKIFPMRG